MKDWLEWLFRSSGLRCAVRLEWVDDVRSVEVIVERSAWDGGGERRIHVEIEALVRLNEDEVVNAFVMPVIGSFMKAA